MWEAARPVVVPQATRLIGPIGKLDEVADGLKALHQLSRQAPEFARRAQRLSDEIDRMTESGVRLDAPTIEAIGKAEARHSRSGRVALWVIAASAVVFVWSNLN